MKNLKDFHKTSRDLSYSQEKVLRLDRRVYTRKEISDYLSQRPRVPVSYSFEGGERSMIGKGRYLEVATIKLQLGEITVYPFFAAERRGGLTPDWQNCDFFKIGFKSRYGITILDEEALLDEVLFHFDHRCALAKAYRSLHERIDRMHAEYVARRDAPRASQNII